MNSNFQQWICAWAILQFSNFYRSRLDSDKVNHVPPNLIEFWASESVILVQSACNVVTIMILRSTVIIMILDTMTPHNPEHNQNQERLLSIINYLTNVILNFNSCLILKITLAIFVKIKDKLYCNNTLCEFLYPSSRHKQ